MGSEGAASTEEASSVKKHELVRQLQFPPGFRFVPTEVEIVDVYLRGKIEGLKLPLDVVNEVKLLNWQPGRLVETYKAYGENKWYFFTEREPSSSKKEKDPDRKVKVSGVTATWKATGSLMKIYKKGSKDMIGTKRILIYHSSDAEEDGKWSMHEYILTGNSQIGQYALCTIQRKQHSDTEHKTSGSSKRKRETIDKDPGETSRRKKAASAKQQKQETTPQLVPPQPPLTPPKEDHQAPRHGSPPSEYAPTSFPSVPVQQGYPSDESQQLLGVSAPMSAGHAQACSYEQEFGDIAAQFDMHLTFCEQQPSLIWSQSLSSDSNIDGAHQYQLYQQQENHGSFGMPNQHVYTGQYLRQHVGFFPRDTNSNWELDLDQIYQEGDGNVFGVQDLYAQDFQSYQLQDHGAMFGQEPAGFGSHDQFIMTSVDSDSAASKGGDSVASLSAVDGSPSDLDLLFCNALLIDAPEATPGQQQLTDNGVDEGSMF